MLLQMTAEGLCRLSCPRTLWGRYAIGGRGIDHPTRIPINRPAEPAARWSGMHISEPMEFSNITVYRELDIDWPILNHPKASWNARDTQGR